MKKKIRLLIVDDHFVVRIGLVTSLSSAPDLSVVAEASTGKQALELYRAHQPDAVLMDLRMPDMNGIQTTVAIRKEFPDAKVIIFSSHDAQEEIFRAFQAGASGYLLKDALGEDLSAAVKTVVSGGKHIPPDIARALAEHTAGSELTIRELDVLRLVIKGLSNREIGDLLEFTEHTAKFHVKNILGKLQVSDRTEAATAALERGILQ